MAQCVTCGSELHPDRATKYDYCMAPACQEKNLKGLTMVAVGVNKAAEQYLVLDEQTRDDLASGKFRDQRRGSFGTSVGILRPRGISRLGGDHSQAVPAPPGFPRRPAPPVEQVAGEAGSAVQRARASSGGNSGQTRPEPLHRHPDHPDLEEPREALSRGRGSQW